MAGRRAIEAALRQLAPKIPPYEFEVVCDHAVDSPGLTTAKADTAAWLTLVAYIRHTLTDYDDLLADGYDRDSARHFVAAAIGETLVAWGVRRGLALEGED